MGANDPNEPNGGERLAFLPQLLSYVHDGVVAVDAKLNITYWNGVAEAITGWAAREVSAEPIGIIVRKAGIGSRFPEIVSCLEKQGFYNGEITARRKDGKAFRADVNIKRIYSQADEPRVTVALFRDVTECRMTEAALRESEQKYQELVKFAPAGIYEVDFRTGKFLSVNDAMCKISGYTREELLAMNVLDFLAGSSRVNFRERTANWLSGRKPDTNVEYTVVGKDGGEIDILLNMSFTADEEGRPLGATGVIYDITQRKRTEAALRESEEHALMLAGELERKNRLVTDFFINISHEFKTPLSILMLGVDLLEKKLEAAGGSDADVSKNIAVMRQNSLRLARLVSNLLDITKLDAGFMEPQWELKNVPEWLGSLVKSTECYARQKGLELEYRCDTPEKRMFTDGFMLDRIMLNLLSNAIKHTPEGGRIVVACRPRKGIVTVSVADTGEGIPANKLPIIFDRFRQVDSKLTHASDGCGIGLALTKSMVELLGGRIWVESEPGRGSTFTFELPERAVEANAKPAQAGMVLDRRVRLELSDIDPI